MQVGPFGGGDKAFDRPLDQGLQTLIVVDAAIGRENALMLAQDLWRQRRIGRFCGQGSRCLRSDGGRDRAGGNKQRRKQRCHPAKPAGYAFQSSPRHHFTQTTSPIS